MTYEPALEVPTDLEKWMYTQSHSEFIGSMLRVMARKGGLTQRQLDMVTAIMDQPK